MTVLSRITMGVMERPSPLAVEFATVTPFSLRNPSEISLQSDSTLECDEPDGCCRNGNEYWEDVRMIAHVRDTQPAKLTGSASISEEFEQLFQRSYHRAYNAAYRMMGNASDAEDLTQEAFVRVWASFDRYDRTRPFEGWLFRILSNLAIDRWRRHAGATVCSLEAEGSGSRPTGPRRGSPLTRDGKSATLLACLADDRPSSMPGGRKSVV